ITSALSATGAVGTAFSYSITASNSPASYGASGLPAGLSANTSTGLISGTPTAAATSNVTISATNSAGTGSATLVLTINPAGTLTASPTSVTAGGNITVGWSNISNATASDFIAMYASGAADTSYLTYQYLNGSTSGSVTFTAPSTAGN